MAELTAANTKLIQYLNEAYGKEKELEQALQAHVQMATKPPYKKRLQAHLKETKAQSKGLERRIKKLGGKADAVAVPDAAPELVQDAAGAAQSLLKKGAAAVKGMGHAVRGTGEEEKLLKNAKTEYANEAEEIANYNAIEALATAIGDTETVKLAREFRRQEERMASFLEKQIPILTKAVAMAEIPAAERKTAGRRRSSASRKAASRRSSASRNGGRARASSKPSGSARSSSRATAARSSSSRSSSGGASSRGSRSRASSRSGRSSAKK